MNHVYFIGRLVREVELTQIGDNQCVVNNALAIQRAMTRPGHEAKTDFIPIVAWNYVARDIAAYAKKGQKIMVSGQMRSRNYEDKEGRRMYVVECLVDQVSFLPIPKRTATEKKSVEPTVSETLEQYKDKHFVHGKAEKTEK